MADNYATGTVSPFLALRPRHKAAWAMLGDASDEDLPPGWVLNDVEDRKLVDAAAFHEWAAKVAEGLAEDEIAAARDFVEKALRTGAVLGGDLQIREMGNDDDGTLVSFLFVETDIPEWLPAYLAWILDDSPNVPYVTFEYALTCSKPREGEFGGGAWFIDRASVRILDTHAWLESQVQSPPPLKTRERKNLLARAAAFIEDPGCLSGLERVELLEDLLSAVDVMGGDEHVRPVMLPKDPDDDDLEEWSAVRDLPARAETFVKNNSGADNTSARRLLTSLRDAVESLDTALTMAGGEDWGEGGEDDRCEHEMFFSGAGACPQCGGGAE